MTSRYDAGVPTAERKRHGIFYTPAPVVRYLLRATAPRGPVADLSCGDGAFLREASSAGYPVMGIDRDPVALARATEALREIAPDHHWLTCGNGLLPDLPATPDVVLGNPPYLEAKKTDPVMKAFCRQQFPAIARGGFDVFICFLQAGLDLLPPGGRLGYILPNKFLVAEYARPLRTALLAEMTIEEVVDVSEIATFQDAAVYPMLIVVRKSPPPPGHRVRIGHVRNLEELDSGSFARTTILQTRWEETARRIIWLPPADSTAQAAVERVLAHAPAKRLKELLDIRWTVSFHRAGLRDQFIFPTPTGACPRRFLGGMRFQGNADLCRYRLDWSGWWIDYDEPRARTVANALPPAALFTGPKLVIAQNARRILATLDTEDFVCKDTFLVGRGREVLPLEYLLGILNSRLLSYYYAILMYATHVGGTYLHYLGCYLEDLPIALPADPAPIITRVQRLLDPALDDTTRHRLDDEVDDLVYDLYGLTAEERALVTAAVPRAWGEAGMRRGQWDAATHTIP